jgi:hypothetical protein
MSVAFFQGIILPTVENNGTGYDKGAHKRVPDFGSVDQGTGSMKQGYTIILK